MTGLHADVHGHIVMALKPSSRVQNIAIGAASVQSTVFQVISQNTINQDTGLSSPSGPSGSTHVRLAPTADCFVLFGTNPVVTVTNGFFLPAGSVEYIPVDVGDVLAVIQSTAGGSLNIAECA